MLFNEELLKILTQRRKKITLEVRADTRHQLCRLGSLKKGRPLTGVNSIRIVGLSRCLNNQWVKDMGHMEKLLDVRIDACPDNTSYTATALAVEALMNGINHMTVTFAGYGRGTGFAAMEEVLAAANLLLNVPVEAKLKILPEVTHCFTEISGVIIPGLKPVIGEDIFKHESGIHTDGIMKDSTTYEPFNPGLVGKERKIVIGKHSGTKVVADKLHELGIEYETEKVDAILEAIRAESIKNKRELNDDEIKMICGVPL